LIFSILTTQLQGEGNMKKAIVFGTLFCFIVAANAQAKDVWEMSDSPKYGEKAGGMLGRGLLNVVSCFVDIPVQMVRGAEQKKPEFMGALGGLATGAGCTILRAGSGVIDVATFWIPNFHGLPVSRGYENCLDFSTTGGSTETGYAPPTTVYEPAGQAAPAESRMKYVKK
jgi:putative exosortase-associated protein (TIGR04073 family)